MEAISPNLAADMRQFIALANRLGIVVPDEVQSEPDNTLDEIFVVSEAHKRYPKTYGSAGRVDWQVRNRERNGLLACGGVGEHKRGRQRAHLTINHPKYVAWLKSGAK
jgi:hypothetical protein